MNRKTMRHILFLSIVMAFLTGSAAAHDTDSPHTHDGAGNVVAPFLDTYAPATIGAHTTQATSAPTAFLVIPIGGESFPFHWLWHFMRGETVDNRIHLVHEMMDWYQIPHFHQPGALKDKTDFSVSPPQYDRPQADAGN